MTLPVRSAFTVLAYNVSTWSGANSREACPKLIFACGSGKYCWKSFHLLSDGSLINPEYACESAGGL